jgi:N-formylglutamate amidohydrolase
MSPHAPEIVLPYELSLPRRQSAPLVLASPHSGRAYAPDLLAMSQLDELTLRQSEDCFVDELFADAPGLGVPLLAATFPRVFLDANREADELDLDMFVDPEPAPGEKRGPSPRVLAGLGVIPRLSSNDREIYAGKLPFTEARRRLDHFYRPYHSQLARLIGETRQHFGCCVLLDCHSMPSTGGGDSSGGRQAISVDYVLGDCFGSSCADPVTAAAEKALAAAGARTRRNSPYSGGHVAQRYGRPASGVHVLQIEINRALYMDEASLRRHQGFAAVRRTMAGLIRELSQAASALARVS